MKTNFFDVENPESGCHHSNPAGKNLITTVKYVNLFLKTTTI
jgi:hypothetical protein